MRHFMIALLVSCLAVQTLLTGTAHAQAETAAPSALLSPRTFLPVLSAKSASHATVEEELVAIQRITVGDDGLPVVTLIFNAGDLPDGSELPTLTVVIAEESATSGLDTPAIVCPWGGTGASIIQSGWFHNPAPDLDYYIDYRLPRNYREATVCITPALWTALTLSRKNLDIRISSLDRDNLRVKIVIGSSVVRNLCQTLTRNPSCADWLLRLQATLRYRT